ncbi:MAG: hypothetical protein P8N43_13270 [Alphaproteobacteria bacterium]|nr:hypothetical protein [Alphaproteobacteria bacterium]
MGILYYVFAAAVLVAGASASIAIWAPRPTRVRLLALVTTVLFIPLVHVQILEVLGKPKPVSFEWYERGAEGAELLSASFDEGRAIYLWLRVDGAFEPRAYVIPWNVRLAEKLEEAVDDAVRRNSTVQLKKPFYRRSFEEWGDLNVEIIPPPLPPQKRPPTEPRVFTQGRNGFSRLT